MRKQKPCRRLDDPKPAIRHFEIDDQEVSSPEEALAVMQIRSQLILRGYVHLLDAGISEAELQAALPQEVRDAIAQAVIENLREQRVTKRWFGQ